MGKYVRTEQIEAEPMTMGEAYERGFLKDGRIPSESDKSNAGYHVEYQDGYDTWYPDDLFKKHYRAVSNEKENMCFGDVIEVLKQGGAIRRKIWNGKGLFIIKQVPAHIGSDIVPKMQSLPQSAKDLILAGKGFIDYTSQCLIYDGNTGRADSWTPSISDVFAEDWEIVNA